MQQVAQGLASLGRGNDKMLVHMTPGEVRGLQGLAMAHGGSLTINPHTGLPEAGFLSSLLPMALGAGAMMIPGMQPWGAAMLVGGGYALSSGSLAKGLQAGLGAYGGAGLGNALAGFGEAGSESILANSPALGMEQAAQQQAQEQAIRQAQETAAKQALESTGASTAGFSPAETQINAQIAGNYGYTPPASIAPVAAPVNSTPLNIEGVAAGASPTYQAPTITPTSRFDQMISGAQNAVARPMDFLQTKGVPTALASAAAPMVSNTLSGMIQPQGIKGIMPQGTSQPNFPNYGFQQTRNPNWGQPGEPYYIQRYASMAAGGQVPSPSLPLDLSQNYPGSNITKSSYATLPSTQPQEIMDGYGPKINPFTGAEGMAAGGLADFKMYPDKNETSGVEDLSPTQLEAAAESDDPTMQGLALLERDRRKGSGTKGYKRREFAEGGMAAMPEYAAGGKLLRGPGDGMSDDIPAVIKGAKPQRAALADGEFVIPADVVSHLGNGSTEAGAKRLYSMMDKVRHARTGNKKQGRQINAERFLPA
jgi:hypothetical protein